MNKNVVIIGLGIAGMSCAIYLKRAGLDVLVIEKDTPGGQLNKTNIVENYPGFSKVTGPELAFNIFEQVQKLDVEYLYDEVIDIKKEEDKFIIKTKNNEITSKYLVIATGRAPRKLKLANEDRLIGNGISYCALCDGSLYKDKEVAVIGGGNSAVEDAIYLSNICKKVYIIHRRDTFRAESKLIEELNSIDNIEIIYNSEVKEYVLKDDIIDKLRLNNDKEIEVDGVFVAIGYEPISSMLDIDNDNNYIIVDSKMNTSMDNVYAVGDAIKKDVYQLITAANEGVISAVDIIKKES